MSGAVRFALLAAGQNVLDPHSGPEHRISVLWWVMMSIAWVGFGLIGFLLLLGWFRRNRATLPFGGDERAATGLVIALGAGVPIVLLTALFVWSDLFVIRSTAAPNPSSTSLTVRVIGHQWWWELRYAGGDAVTANELHIPTNTRVNVIGTTADVIHSFWVPELNRKIDLVPGRENRLLLYADRPGTYRGQCAEFCGLQHAHMEVLVFAQPRGEFDSWLRRQSEPAEAASSRGAEVFQREGCADCHAIRGTPANAHVGPDLTHEGSRTTLAAGLIPNDRSHLLRWISDPQSVKPGAKMPALHLSRPDLAVVVDYLRGLK
jgi:cytochrome c oxidase subunit II